MLGLQTNVTSLKTRIVFVSCLTALVVGCLGLIGGPKAFAADSPETLTNYTDPSQALAWGQRSHWKQPWRSYQDTVPATTLLNAIGINFNVTSTQATQTAKLLGDSGFKRARLEIGWNALDYNNPSLMTSAAHQNLEAKLTALRNNGIRPLILLNSNSGEPCPVRRGAIELMAPAYAGATTIQVNPRDLNEIIPGRTGLTTEGIAAHVIFTSMEPNGTVKLSQPLPEVLPAGSLNVVTLLYEPFSSPNLTSGATNPRFEHTVQGWLNYANVITREAKSILGSEAFDIEIWNELTFGSQFLGINNYYAPELETQNGSATTEAILRRTVEYLRNPAHGTPNIGIGNGFANTVPWANGSQSPVGLTAIDKHPYHGLTAFGNGGLVNGNRPLNGLGEPAGWLTEHQWHESFTPNYNAFFPEYFLSGIQTETLTHDLSPTPSLINGVEHGRYTHPPGGSAPSMWITEVNMDPSNGPTPASEMSAKDIRHIETKDTLRYLTAYINKGVTALDLYAANAGNLSLIDHGFFADLKASPSVYPGDAAGGETTEAVKRLAASMRGAEMITAPRSVTLNELTQYTNNAQFEGNGSPEYPPLYNREVFAFLPFQVTQHSFVIPVYVMTRNVAHVYRPEAAASNPTRFDMPAEPYKMAIGGINGNIAQVSATDPLTAETVPVKVIARASNRIVVEMPVTDSPRLLAIQEQPVETTPTESPVPHTKRNRSSAVQFQLRSQASLLQKHRLTVTAKCGNACDLRADGVLKVGSHKFTMDQAHRRTNQSHGLSTQPAIVLVVHAHAVRQLRQALKRHATVSAHVTASAAFTDYEPAPSARETLTMRIAHSR